MSPPEGSSGGPGPPRTLRDHARVPRLLLGVLGLVAVATLWDPPAGRTSWLLEVGPGLIGIAVLVAVYRRFPMSFLVYGLVFALVTARERRDPEARSCRPA